MITILIGKSAAGKDTFYQKMIENGYLPITSCTTRPMREGECEGREYFFKTEREFLALIKSGDIFEYRTYQTYVKRTKATWYYGSLKQDLDPEKNYVAVLELTGALAYINAYGADQCKIIYITASAEERKRRAMLRGGFDEDEWNRRAKADDSDFSEDNIHALVDLMKSRFIEIVNE